ncbi:MAG: TetR/AcrR family transcriptional regulator, partial [Deltaproteobacteria bacterium]
MGVLSTFNQIDKRKQKRIISAALTEFANNGYHGTSINNIAKKVG